MYKDGNIEGVTIKELRFFNDARGWLAEIYRTDELPEGLTPVMSYISMTKPGVARGPHEHVEQTDIFIFLTNFTLYLWDRREHSPTHKNRIVLRDSKNKIVVVPPGVVHAYKNADTVDGMVINLPDRLYAGKGKKEPVDEIRWEDSDDSPYKLD
ncbi:MAG: dTDP-4-dehydrorhamnose 3,5-epimerase family protein [Nitrospirae bacterium]|nr:dTDP-4-dehydrorhamnose 3,5-epimerase family protein [Nitrospirota bacterium]MBF0534333.1 dTDP-4-dehydrorhamnose 3,5-epimerase family protein [Nitrospirota bacterium]MBF0615686.1 dTDP-4-dehydrorhamnose 3,5-epimerase family protein [Nitrospirota bacterium]